MKKICDLETVFETKPTIFQIQYIFLYYYFFFLNIFIHEKCIVERWLLSIRDGNYHIFKTEVVVDEQEVSPPSFLANVGVMFDHKIPLWTGTQVR